MKIKITNSFTKEELSLLYSALKLLGNEIESELPINMRSSSKIAQKIRESIEIDKED
jgi:hypothetical protein